MLRESCESHKKEQDREYRDCGTDNTNNSIHSLGQVGHIEDIAVAKDQQGKKLGLRIIQALDHVAEKVGCYKVCSNQCPRHSGQHTSILINVIQTILDCSEANEGFYVKCGFKRAGLEMAHYYNKS